MLSCSFRFITDDVVECRSKFLIVVQLRNITNSHLSRRGLRVRISPVGNRSNIDHAIPKSRGGNKSAANAQNTCQTCNLQKATQTTEEFLNRGN